MIAKPAVLLGGIVSAWLLACSAQGERPRPSPATPSLDGASRSSNVRALADEAPSQTLWPNRTNQIGVASYEQLAAPLPGRDPGGLVWFRDRGERRLGFMRRANPTDAEEIYALGKQGDLWSSPLAAQLPAFRVRALSDVGELSSGRAMLLMVGDDTDYMQVVGLSPDGSRAAISDAELTQLQNQNRRLFSSFAVDSAWSRPVPIPGTLGVLFAALETGPDQRAYAVFSRDDDNAYDTTDDRDLYVSVFDGRRWHEPLRLTSDAGREYAVETAFIDGELVIAWVRDADADLNSDGDRVVYAATLSPDGTLTRVPAPISTTTYERPRPVLGELQGRPIVLFAGNPVADTATRPLLESRLAAAWSAPSPTGLSVGNVSRGAIFRHDDAAVLVYEDDNHLVAAVSRGGAWHSSGVVQDYNDSKFRLGEASYVLDEDARLWIAAVGAERLGDATSAGALFHVQVPLYSDLDIADILSRPKHVQLGDVVTLRIPVSNRGYLPSGAFDLMVRDGDQLLASAHQEDGLYPGESRTVELSFPMTRTQHNLKVSALAIGAPPPPELDVDNNTRAVSVAVRPDFAVASVERAGDTITAVVRDLKGVATTPVNVDFLLFEGSTSTSLAQKTFDPNTSLPIALEVPGLQGKTAPYVISVRVNDRTSVLEDDHQNNLGTYAYQPSADFVIDALEVAADTVTIAVRNVGVVPAEQVAILLTTNPELSASPAPISGVEPIALQEVALHDGRATLQLPRSVLAGHAGYFLYAVVNPYGAVVERNRRDNLQKSAVEPVEAPPPPIGPRPALYALRRIELKAGAKVTGDLAVRDAAPSAQAPSIDVGPDARVEGDLRADGVRLGAKASVLGSVFYNALSTQPDSTISGALRTPLALPVAATIPPLPQSTPGTTRVVVARGGLRVLPPGAYGELCVGCSGGDVSRTAHLLLSGGTYDVRSIRSLANTRITCAGACELRVAADVSLAEASSLGPFPVSGLGPEQIRLFVAGAAVSLAAGAELTSDLVASAAVVKLGQGARASGRVVASEIQLGPNVVFTGVARPAAKRAPLGVTLRVQPRSSTP